MQLLNYTYTWQLKAQSSLNIIKTKILLHLLYIRFYWIRLLVVVSLFVITAMSVTAIRLDLNGVGVDDVFDLLVTGGFVARIMQVVIQEQKDHLPHLLIDIRSPTVDPCSRYKLSLVDFRSHPFSWMMEIKNEGNYFFLLSYCCWMLFATGLFNSITFQLNK